MNKRFIILLIILLCFISLLGCTRAEIIDKLSIIHVFGFDIDEEEQQLIATALYPNYTVSKRSDEIKHLKEKAPTGALFLQKLDQYTSMPVKLSKIRVLLFGMDYAKSGIGDMVDRFVINPEVGTNIQIVVSEQSAEETLRAIQKEGSLTLADKLTSNMEVHQLPMMNLHIFLNHFYGEGMDPFIPIVSIHDDETVKISNIGILKDDKFKLKLDEKETFLFSIIEDFKAQGTYSLFTDEKKDRQDIIAVRGFKSKTDWDLIDKKPNRELDLTLNLEWVVTQYPKSSFDLTKKEDIQKLKKLITRNVKEGVEGLIQKLKENEVDPLGIGNIVRARDRGWNEETFYEEYPNLPINVEVNLEIIHTGLEA